MSGTPHTVEFILHCMKLIIHGKEMEVSEASPEQMTELQDLLSFGKEAEVQTLLKKWKLVEVSGQHQNNSQP